MIRALVYKKKEILFLLFLIITTTTTYYHNERNYQRASNCMHFAYSTCTHRSKLRRLWLPSHRRRAIQVFELRRLRPLPSMRSERRDPPREPCLYENKSARARPSRVSKTNSVAAQYASALSRTAQLSLVASRHFWQRMHGQSDGDTQYVRFVECTADIRCHGASARVSSSRALDF